VSPKCELAFDVKRNVGPRLLGPVRVRKACVVIVFIDFVVVIVVPRGQRRRPRLRLRLAVTVVWPKLLEFTCG